MDEMTCAGGEASLSLRIDDEVPYTGFSIKCSQSYERMPTQTQGSFRFWDTDDQARAARLRCTYAAGQWERGMPRDVAMLFFTDQLPCIRSQALSTMRAQLCLSADFHPPWQC